VIVGFFALNEVDYQAFETFFWKLGHESGKHRRNTRDDWPCMGGDVDDWYGLYPTRPLGAARLSRQNKSRIPGGLYKHYGYLFLIRA
jgi:hypothetical protein